LEAAFLAFWVAWIRILNVRRNLYICFAVVLNEILQSEMKPKRVHPDSAAGKLLLKMLADKKLIDAYLRDEITKEELESKGVKLVNPF
jgi:hypothetical protein